MTTATARADRTEEATARAARARANQFYVRLLLAIREPELDNLLEHLTAACPVCGGLLNVPHNARPPEP